MLIAPFPNHTPGADKISCSFFEVPGSNGTCVSMSEFFRGFGQTKQGITFLFVFSPEAFIRWHRGRQWNFMFNNQVDYMVGAERIRNSEPPGSRRLAVCATRLALQRPDLGRVSVTWLKRLQVTIRLCLFCVVLPLADAVPCSARAGLRPGAARRCSDCGNDRVLLRVLVHISWDRGRRERPRLRTSRCCARTGVAAFWSTGSLAARYYSQRR